MCRFVAKELVFIRFDRPDNHVYLVVLHVQPSHVASLIVVREQGFCPHVQVFLQGLIVGQGRCLPKQPGCFLHLISKLLVVRNRLQLASLIASQKGVQAGLAFELGGFKFFLRHIDRIEISARRLGAYAVDERLIARQAVPRAVVDGNVTFQLFIGESLHQAILFTIGLVPKQLIHDLTCLDEDRDHLFLFVCEQV